MLTSGEMGEAKEKGPREGTGPRTPGAVKPAAAQGGKELR